MASDDADLDPRAILDALGVSEVGAVERAQGGSDSAIWRVEAAGGPYALRVFAAGEQADCERERVVMHAARDAGLPVPAVHAAGSWRGRLALLLTWLPGRTVAEELERKPARAAYLGAIFGEMQAQMHTVAAPAPLAAYPNAWIDWLGPNAPALAERLRASDYPGGALLHLDYHPLNVLTDGERITGILDWRNATAGEPRADVARTHAILRIDAPYHVSRMMERLLKHFRRAWIEAYARQAGPLQEMRPFYAWAGASMLRDLAAKRSPEDLARIREWTDRWLEWL